MPFYPFFWHISETVRATSPHMSRKVERNENFEKNMLVWRDLTAFITAFCDFVSSTMDVYEANSSLKYLYCNTVHSFSCHLVILLQMFCMLYSNELAASLLADLQYRPPVNVFISHTCTTFSFLYCKAQ